MSTLLSYSLICGAFFFAGIVDAISGGGGLLTIPTFLALGFPVRSVAGTNQSACLLGAITSTWRFARNGKIHWRAALVAGPLSVIGSFFGARLNLIVPERVLQIVMVALVPLVAIAVLAKRDLGAENQAATLSKRRSALISAGIGLVIGAYAGFYGAGAGTFMILAFAALHKLDLVTASGTARFCTLCATTTAMITYAASGVVDWKVALAASAFNMLGNYLGTGLALRKGAKIVRPMFLVVLAGLFIRLVWTALF